MLRLQITLAVFALEIILEIPLSMVFLDLRTTQARENVIQKNTAHLYGNGVDLDGGCRTLNVNLQIFGNSFCMTYTLALKWTFVYGFSEGSTAQFALNNNISQQEHNTTHLDIPSCLRLAVPGTAALCAPVGARWRAGASAGQRVAPRRQRLCTLR